ADAAQAVVDANPVYSLPRAILAGALVRLGRADEARRMAQSVLEREPSFTIRGTAIYAALEPRVFERFADAWREAGLRQCRQRTEAASGRRIAAQARHRLGHRHDVGDLAVHVAQRHGGVLGVVRADRLARDDHGEIALVGVDRGHADARMGVDAGE